MAYIVGAAGAAVFNNELSAAFNPALSPRDDSANFAKLNPRAIISGTANNSSSETTTAAPSDPTVNLFINGLGEGFGYAGAVLTACADRTVYEIQCTSAPYSSYIGTATCGPKAPKLTVTEGSDMYEVYLATSAQTLGSNVAATVSASCSLAGTTAAACAVTLGGTVDGTVTSTSTMASLASSNYDYFRYDVTLTAGAEKTASPTATNCNVRAAPAETTNSKSEGSVLSSKRMAMWMLVGVMSVLAI